MKESGGKKNKKGGCTYKSIAFGSSSGFISDDNSLQDLSKLFKVFLHGLFLGLPSQPTNKDFGVGGVSELAC